MFLNLRKNVVGSSTGFFIQLPENLHRHDKSLVTGRVILPYSIQLIINPIQNPPQKTK